MISYSHNMSLAVASIVVSIIAAITGLAMMSELRKLPDSRRKAVIAMSAFVLGIGIWSMHFLAMLALRFDVPIHYDLLQTLGSGLIAILVVGFALLLLHFRIRTNLTLTVAGIALGLGIVVMHFVGMLGMRGVIPQFSMLAIVAAVAVALVTGVAAVRLSYGSRSRENIVKGGFMFGLAVALVHHTAMLATHFAVDPSYSELAIALDQETLAIAVTVAAFVICGSFLLAASTFVPAEKIPANAAKLHDSAESSDEIPESSRDQLSNGNAQASGQAGLVKFSNQPGSGAIAVDEHEQSMRVGRVGHVGQAGQAGDAVSKTQIRDVHIQPDDPDAVDAADTLKASHQDVLNARPARLTSPPVQPVVKIPFEEHKRVLFVPSQEVAAIRADGHYTKLYSVAGVKFCPWSITEAEKRLGNCGFYRSHRSYLINVQAVCGFEKNRDAGICRFEGYVQLSTVPVSRARVGNLLKELGL